MPYFYIFSSVLIVSLISLVGVFALSFKEEFLRKSLFVLVGLAAGALFGDALIHLIPESLEEASNPAFVSIAILAGILIFFALEKFLHWHHHHGVEEENCKHQHEVRERNVKPLGYLVLTSDTVHNFIDGVIIAAGYMISIETGIATTIAVILHEIPQEVADFSLLIHSGISKMKALALNFVTALSAVLGAALVVFTKLQSENLIPYLGAFAAGAFLYIAGSDLVPEIHKTHDMRKSAIQFASIIVGILITLSLIFLEM